MVRLRPKGVSKGKMAVQLDCTPQSPQASQTASLMNTHQQPTGQFAKDADWQFPVHEVRGLIQEAVKDRLLQLDATRLATALMGDGIATNLFMLGFAYQKGLLPVSAEALLRAIELNGVAVSANGQAFTWGRRAAVDLAAVQNAATPATPITFMKPESLREIVQHRVAQLTVYQNAAYALRYQAMVERVRQAELPLGQGDALSKAVAISLFKLMAYKDEYEVARLYTDGAFKAKLEQQFEGDLRLQFHLAPPMLSSHDEQGRLKKSSYGAWVFTAMRVLAKLKFLRGTACDLFGYTNERRIERRLRDDYISLVERLLPGLTADRLSSHVELLSLPQQIRGFGHVKLATVNNYQRQLDQMLQTKDFQ